MKKILLIGGGGHCKAVIDVIEQEGKYCIAGIIDKRELLGKKVLGYEVIGCDDDLEKLRRNISFAIITIGHVKSNTSRIKLYEHLKSLDFELPTIISPLAYVSKHASVGEGSIVMHHALINADSKVGTNCIINSKALCEHDSIVQDNCHISTGAILNGGATVKENSFVGSLATVVQYATVGGFIKAGSISK